MKNMEVFSRGSDTGAGGQIVRPLSIYIHIPFCVRKCGYCDFLSFPASEQIRENYVQALLGQIRSAGTDSYLPYPEEVIRRTGSPLQAYEVVSIFLGGGTPSVLSGRQIGQILQAVTDTFKIAADAEITMECNPGTVDGDKLREFYGAGINRLSFGVQAAQDDLLRTLGRVHTWEMFLECWDLSDRAGFINRSLDLMSGLPGQTLPMWEDTLRRAAALGPKHISAYGLIIEEGTPFWNRYREDEERRDRGLPPRILPDEDVDREMYHVTKGILEKYGLQRYEISNYALPGSESVHNKGYWQRREYIGFGLGAASQLGEHRFRCTEDMETYLGNAGRPAGDAEKPKDRTDSLYVDRQRLTKRDQMEETMFLGLRMTKGIPVDLFERRFGLTLDRVYGDVIQKLKERELLEQTGTHLRLTERGIDISNAVLAEFLLD